MRSLLCGVFEPGYFVVRCIRSHFLRKEEKKWSELSFVIRFLCLLSGLAGALSDRRVAGRQGNAKNLSYSRNGVNCYDYLTGFTFLFHFLCCAAIVWMQSRAEELFLVRFSFSCSDLCVSFFSFCYLKRNLIRFFVTFACKLKVFYACGSSVLCLLDDGVAGGW